MEGFEQKIIEILKEDESAQKETTPYGNADVRAPERRVRLQGRTVPSAPGG